MPRTAVQPDTTLKVMQTEVRKLQQELVFTSAVAADTKEADAAKALIDYLKTQDATAVIKAAGMTPG